MQKKYLFSKEKDMYTYFNKLFTEKQYFYYKLSDSSMWYKPYDAILRNKEYTYHIEYKFLKNTKEDVYKSLRPQQKYALNQIHKLWWKAIIIVYYNQEDDLVFYEYWDWFSKYNIEML